MRLGGFGTGGRVCLRGEVTSRHLRENVQEASGDSAVELQGETEWNGKSRGNNGQRVVIKVPKNEGNEVKEKKGLDLRE